MKINIFFLSIVTFLVSLNAYANKTPWFVEKTFYKLNDPLISDVFLRTGYYLESDKTSFKGCIIYLEGLADSVLNHHPLFHKLAASGYRVLFFDYMGQGGSEGSMNNTRILSSTSSLQISSQAKFVWNKYSAQKVQGKDCSHSKKLVIGWSTGGLAAYGLAYEQWADAVILIAPGIHPKKFVGEAADQPYLMFTLAQVITERTLTRNKFNNQVNPHFDPIKPISPSVVPLFSVNLVLSSERSQKWKITNKIQGLVFLSGTEDTYVDRAKTLVTINRNATHFKTAVYDGALHEIDNEISEISDDMHDKTVKFFNSLLEVR